MKQIRMSVAQTRAIESESQALVIVAGAGSGKTEVLARRIERILTSSPEDESRILAVSFTVRAADELRDRLATRLGDLHHRVDADTVHGFAFSLLRQSGTRIGLPVEPEVLAADADRAELLTSWLSSNGFSVPFDTSETLREFDSARARCNDAPMLDEWREALASHGAVDYPAMLERAVELVETKTLQRQLSRLYSHVVVDEAQNLTPAQYLFLTTIIGDPHSTSIRTVLVGDERQSIVGFAGADPALIRKFEQDYDAERVELHTNFRSAKRIVEMGRRVAAALGQPDHSDDAEYPADGAIHVQSVPSEEHEGRFIARWISTLLEQGLPTEILPDGESGGLAAEDIAVLGRSAAVLRSTRSALEAAGIDHASASTEIDWVTTAAARTAVDMIAFLGAPKHRSTRRRLAEAAGIEPGSDWVSLAELIGDADDPDVAGLAPLAQTATAEAFVSKLGEINCEDLNWGADRTEIEEAWAGFIDRTNVNGRSFANFRQHIARCQRGDSLDPGVRLLTVHKAQGREFKGVAVVACNQGQFPDFRAESSEDFEAELRTFYVAVTRPSRLLLLTRSEARQTRYGTRATDPSSFLRFAQEPS